MKSTYCCKLVTVGDIGDTRWMASGIQWLQPAMQRIKLRQQKMSIATSQILKITGNADRKWK